MKQQRRVELDVGVEPAIRLPLAQQAQRGDFDSSRQLVQRAVAVAGVKAFRRSRQHVGPRIADAVDAMAESHQPLAAIELRADNRLRPLGGANLQHHIERRAWRAAQGLGADLDLLHVSKKSLGARDEESDELQALRRLASALGAHVIVEEGDDVADVASRVAAERGTTYVMIGQPRSAQGLRRFGESLPEKLLRKLPGVDIRIVADRAQRKDDRG